MGKKKIILFLLIISFVLPFFIMSNVKAEEVKKNKEIYCPLCSHTDPSDPLYEKERQFYYKVKSIKEKYGDSIDEVALIAAVLHRYSNNELMYKANFDTNFDSDSYNNSLDSIKKMYLNDASLSSSDINSIIKNEKLDLLTIAAIVMVDSNHGNTYSDVCFKKALAGDRLIGNDREDKNYFDKMISSILNKAVCESVKKEIENYSNSSNSITSNYEIQRINNINSVCENGYIGGLYSEVSKIKDEKLKQDVKNNNADGIIDLANYYKKLYGSGVEEENGCSLNVAGSTGEFASWRQFDDKWKNITLGGNSNVGNAGCLVTSIAMQIARSGTKIGTLPSRYSEFNPGAFVTSLNDNGAFVGGGNFGWTGYQNIAPNWGVGDFITLNENKNTELAAAVSKELSSGYGSENYQKFIVLQIHHASSSQHWVAVNGVTDGKVTIYDPAMSGTTLDDNYKNWVVDGYRVMYAKDVPFGQTGTTSNNTCFVSSINTGSTGTTGDIKIPEEYGRGGYTVTTIDTINWAPGTGQGELAEEWKRKGAQYKNGIAVIDGRYLIACTTTFGKVGDKIDFYLDDGTKIPTIMMDEKSQQVVAWDPNPANKWGHDNGANILEFEVSSSHYRKYGNPGNGYNNWYKEWSNKRVASATNLGKDGVSSENTSQGAKCVDGRAVGLNVLNYSNAVDVPDELWKKYDKNADPSIIVVDDNGNVVASRKADIRREGASTNKIFTGYSALNLLDVNSDTIKGSKYVYNISSSTHDFFGPGQTMSVIKAATLAFPGSKNRVADSIVLTIGYKYCNCNSDKKAYATGIDKMNELFKQIGCTNTNIGTGSGINGIFGATSNRGFDKYGITKNSNGNGFSAGDLALVTIETMKDNNFANHFGNRNNEGLFYIKSGTQKCGHGVWGFNKNGKRYYMVILGVKCGGNDNQKRNAKFAIRDSVYNWTIKNAIR